MERTDDLLAACVAAPEDDAPRLVWADAIGGERGELIVVQCDLARGGLDPAAYAQRARRERELLAVHGEAWARRDGMPIRIENEEAFAAGPSGLSAEEVVALLGGFVTRVRYRRGFIAAIEADATAFVSRGAEVVRAAPLLTSLTATSSPVPDPRPLVADLLAAPTMARITALDLRGINLALGETANGARRIDEVLLGSDALPHLRALALPEWSDPDALLVLSHSTALRHFRKLWLPSAYNDPGSQLAWLDMPRLASISLDADVAVLAPARLRVTEAYLRGARAGQLAAIVRDGAVATLERLVIHTANRELLDATDVRALARLPRLRELDLSAAVLSEHAARVLSVLDVPALRVLRLGWSGAESVRAIAVRFAPQLCVLDLRATRRIEPPTAGDGDVLVDEPTETDLLHDEPTVDDWRLHPRRGHHASQQLAAWLVLESGEAAGRVIEIADATREPFKIGRSVECELRVVDGSVARRHATITVRPSDGGYVLRDMLTANGTYVNQERVRETVLADSDRIHIGMVALRFFVGASAGERATAAARWLEAVEPRTGLSRTAPPRAAAIVLTNFTALSDTYGRIAVDFAIAEIGARLAALAGADAQLACIGPAAFAVAPPERAGELAALASTQPVLIDGESLAIQLRASAAS